MTLPFMHRFDSFITFGGVIVLTCWTFGYILSVAVARFSVLVWSRASAMVLPTTYSEPTDNKRLFIYGEP